MSSGNDSTGIWRASVSTSSTRPGNLDLRVVTHERPTRRQRHAIADVAVGVVVRAARQRAAPRSTSRSVSRCAASARGRTCHTVGVAAADSYTELAADSDPHQRGRVERHDVDRDLQLVLRAFRVDHAFEWRHVAVVPTERIGDVPIGDEPVVRRIEVYPSRVGYEHGSPRVRNIGADEARLARAAGPSRGSRSRSGRRARPIADSRPRGGRSPGTRPCGIRAAR